MKDSIGPLKGNSGEISSNSNFTADELNKFFVSSCTRENSNDIIDPNIIFDSAEDEKLKHIDITPDLVRKHINQLKRNKSPGPDNLGSSLLLDICENIVEPLCIIFERSLRLHQVPADWREANVTPIFKKR